MANIAAVKELVINIAAHKQDDDDLLALDEFLSNSNELEYIFTNDTGEAYSIERTPNGFIVDIVDNSSDPTTADQLHHLIRLVK